MTQVWDEGSAGRVRVSRWRHDSTTWKRDLEQHRRHLEHFKRSPSLLSSQQGRARPGLGGDGRESNACSGWGGNRRGNAAASSRSRALGAPVPRGVEATDTPWGNYDEWGALGQENARRQRILGHLRSPKAPWNATVLELMEMIVMVEEEKQRKEDEEEAVRQSRKVEALIQRTMLDDAALQVPQKGPTKSKRAILRAKEP
jgi:hypothetical protein